MRNGELEIRNEEWGMRNGDTHCEWVFCRYSYPMMRVA